MLIPNLLLIAGTGNKSGKTSAACRIIGSLPDLSITAIKITPHFHETTGGLDALTESEGYSIYEETNRESGKDTARMLQSGAARVYFAKVWDDNLPAAFLKIMEIIPEGMPVVCESPALRNFIEPGLFIIMTSDNTYNKKDIKHLQSLPHLMIKLEELENNASLPFVFEEGKWILKSEV
ncbi:MAG: hypothetical protein A2X05_06455 [Bacteroidetes bacterium GWE2_41_25]|nr:MAG: hypothetical protein A2X06_02435 [Bacteroidetes bacterium GWC2_40_22]OFY13296.1 MAG: hypothetical protein A2X05_06455 [Bacteroidetes bacterium GWE2_41_25]OFY58904.1 MAG: hypothetical protein A2X04_07180 [Bacteroidetes bacterium GWF2_41_9]HBH83415.1 hypothetical protein [Bacteroidales bacterium]HBQ84184.1 hypothetical protein [Bacteroidales bacterium]